MQDKKVRKDAFLIVRVSKFEKDTLLDMAKKQDKKLSFVVRAIIERYLANEK